MGFPDLDEALEGVVRGEVLGLEGLHRGWAGVVAVVEPGLDAGSVVGHARAETDWGFHDIKRDGAFEEAWDCDYKIVSHHLRKNRFQGCCLRL